jgi:hypothetical protein
MLNKILVLIGMISSNLMHKPSKLFVNIVKYSLMAMGSILAYFYSPLLQLIPGFINEWIEVGNKENFHFYLLLTSYSILVGACILLIKSMAFDCALYLKTNFK